MFSLNHHNSRCRWSMNNYAWRVIILRSFVYFYYGLTSGHHDFVQVSAWLPSTVVSKRVKAVRMLSSVTTTNYPSAPKAVCVVVGKIIIDEYLQKLPSSSLSESCNFENKTEESKTLTIGGGGPQAAWGAAAALAVKEWTNNRGDADFYEGVTEGLSKEPPPPQPVLFLGPVGKIDWTKAENEELFDLLSPAIQSINVIEGEGLRTPRIQLWHDDEQNVQWKALNDSFGAEGADCLWRNRPSSQDIRNALDCYNDNDDLLITLHMILEGGATAAGSGEDAAPLLDDTLFIDRNIQFVGIEPVAFPEESDSNSGTEKLSTTDANSCEQLLKSINHVVDFISPDSAMFNSSLDWNAVCSDGKNNTGVAAIAVRDGPRGSELYLDFAANSDSLPLSIKMPAAILNTSDGNPVNPTGEEMLMPVP
mmetsp:Transcript_14422/g.16608  ORF Transcript_14422/g.16608 Transcript_14422/m.16608 type:complete len:421 (+) Transcript_14422:114-1376(+)